MPQGRWDGVLLFGSSDLEYACIVLGLQHFNSPEPCCYCAANETDSPFNDFHAAACWRRTVFTPGQFLRRIRQPRHDLTASTWFNLHSYRLGMLHLLDHHGLASLILGNILWHHLRRACRLLPGDSQGDRLDFLNDDIRGFYTTRAVQNRLPRLKLSNAIEGGGYPELKGRAVKAANTRALVPYAVDLQRLDLQS